MTDLQNSADQTLPRASCRLPPRRRAAGQLELIQASDQDHAALEAFVRQVFARVYGASVSQFMPRLIGLRNAQGRLVAALGMRSAASGPLFLEQYLDAPVERLLEAHAGTEVGRAGIMELGNLAAEHPGSSRRLIMNLAVCLHQAGFVWVVFTITPSLVNSFRRLGLDLICLGSARRERLAPEVRVEWGRYYDSGPKVYAAHIPGGLPTIRALLQPGARTLDGGPQPACGSGVLALAG
jgi:hypothetical protein